MLRQPSWFSSSVSLPLRTSQAQNQNQSRPLQGNLLNLEARHDLQLNHKPKGADIDVAFPVIQVINIKYVFVVMAVILRTLRVDIRFRGTRGRHYLFYKR